MDTEEDNLIDSGSQLSSSAQSKPNRKNKGISEHQIKRSIKTGLNPLIIDLGTSGVNDQRQEL